MAKSGSAPHCKAKPLPPNSWPRPRAQGWVGAGRAASGRAIGLALAAVLAVGCGDFTIRTWVKVVPEQSGGTILLGGVLPVQITSLQGGFLTAIQINTSRLLPQARGTIAIENVRLAGQTDNPGIGQICTWNDPAGHSGGTLTIDLLGATATTDVFLDAKATTTLSQAFGMPPVDLEEPVDFDLGGALDPAQLASALETGSTAGLFETTTSVASDTTVGGLPATFSMTLALTNGPEPPAFDPRLLAFCEPFFEQQGRSLFYGVNPKSSYLVRYKNDRPQPPLVIPLADLGAAPGDTLRLSSVGTYSWLPALSDGDKTKLGAVFSASAEVLDPSHLRRIPDAIDAGPDLGTWPTRFCVWIGCFPLAGGNDIAEDFRIDPSVDVTVPPRAKYLIVAPVDDTRIWKDNVGLGFGVSVEVNPAG